MDLYTRSAAALAQLLTEQYSTSFSAASRLFHTSIRADIYNIYGLVRIADEIVDTYSGDDKQILLDDFEAATYEALRRTYSTNPIIHAFAVTALRYGIDRTLIEPFFTSMRMDLTEKQHDDDSLQSYIYGSAEVVGLMCLRVFCNGDAALYEQLMPGAQRLGAAYQKVNFLRDVAEDYNQLGRYYFVGTTFESLDETAKTAIIQDITADFDAARPYVADLPITARSAVALSYQYYRALLTKLDHTPITTIKTQRIRLSKVQKICLYVLVRFGVKR